MAFAAGIRSNKLVPDRWITYRRLKKGIEDCFFLGSSYDLGRLIFSA